MKHPAIKALLIIGVWISAATSLAREPQSGPVITTFSLDNDMRAIVIEDHRAPVVTHMVWYRVGAADEPPGKSGIAHYLEHLMFKSTDSLASGEFSKIIAENGGQDNAFTSRDYTAYHQRISKDRLELVMRMEADRMINLVLTDEDLTTERAVVLEERSSRTDNNVQNQFFEDFSAALYLNHPYGVPVIGWRHEIEALTLKDATDFYEKYYAPQNALLVVAGDVDPNDVKMLAEKYYGVISNRGVIPSPRPEEPPHRAERRLSMTDPQIRQDYFTRAYLVPSYVTGTAKETAALALFAEILGGGATSRLSKKLVRGEDKALYAGAYYSGLAKDNSSFGVYAAPTAGLSLADIEAEVDAVMQAFIAEGPTDAELVRAKNVSIASRIYQQDSQVSMARLYGAALTIGLTVEQIKNWPTVIESITAHDVQMAGKSLDRKASVTGWLVTKKTEAAQ